ncbi:C-type lectin-related protein 2.1, partial [Biomphalaria glabrata]
MGTDVWATLFQPQLYPSSRLTFTGNSETIKEIFEPLILSCSFQVAKHDVKENGNVILMYIFQETKGVIATISKGQPFAYSTEPRHTFAQGNIGDEKLNKSYLQVTRKNPNSLESGKYFCLAHVRDSAGKDKVFHASIKINIEKSNSDDLVPALGRVLERLDRIEERQEATEQKIVDAQEDFNIQIKNLSIVLDQEKPEKEEALGRVLERLDRIEERQEATEQKIVDAQEDFNIQIGNLSSVLDQEKPKKEE